MIPSDADIDHDDALTRVQVARVYGVHPDTVTRWRKEGKLIPAFATLGGHSRWRRSQLAEFTPARKRADRGD